MPGRVFPVLFFILLLPLVSTAQRGAIVPEGAFGLRFDEAIPEEHLGAKLARTPASLAGRINFPASPVGVDVPWRRFRPTAVPGRLAALAPVTSVLPDADGRPTRILLEARTADPNQCDAVSSWLTEVLRVKYWTVDGFEQRFGDSRQYVEVGCTDEHVVFTDYVHESAFTMARARHEAAIAAYEEALEERRLVASKALADSFTLGDFRRIKGVFDIAMHDPQPEALELPVDQRVPLTFARTVPPFDRATLTITVGPDAVPIELRAGLEELSQPEFERLTEALRVKYGVPYKHSSKHILFRINGDFLSLRRVGAGARLTAVNGGARKAMEARAVARKQQLFEEETAGL